MTWTDHDDYDQSAADHHALLESLDGPEPDEGWTDEQLAADDARARTHADDPQPETGTPFTRAEWRFLP